MCLPGATTRLADHILKFYVPKAGHLPLGWGTQKQNRTMACLCECLCECLCGCWVLAEAGMGGEGAYDGEVMGALGR